MEAKAYPSNVIGKALVDGMAEFDSQVHKVEEVCLAAVPQELRDSSPIDENGDLSYEWRRCLAPGLEGLQKEAEKTKGK